MSCGGFLAKHSVLREKDKGLMIIIKAFAEALLFLDVARICEADKPKVIFCENVKGLKIHDRGRTFEIIKKTF